jgi:exosortase
MMAATSIVVPRPTAVLAGTFAVLGVLFAVLAGYGDALSEMIARWSHEEEYSYAFLVPILSVWLVWTRRDILPANIGRPAWIAPAVMLIAVAMNAVSEWSATYIFSQWSLILVIVALILSVGGRQLLKVVWVPVIFLLFAIPIPYSINSMISAKLKLISSALGGLLINLPRNPGFH